MENVPLVVPGLVALLDHLAASNPAAGAHGRWRYTRAAGGANNLVYRAASPGHQIAVKWAIRDERDRAGREFGALAALHAAGLDLAPAPLLLERERYPQPVVVQTWLAGPVAAQPPASDAGWRALLGHYLALHAFTPAHTTQPILPAVLTMRSAAEGLARIRQQLAYIPPAERPAELAELACAAERRAWPVWPAPPLALCRVDSNPRNFVRRRSGWLSVDWENSGWGDPAFEIADMITHPAHAGVPAERWEWLIEAYAGARGEPEAARRIGVYTALMLVWWAARFARTLYEVPRGGDRRLAGRAASWRADAQAGYQRVVTLARAALG